MDIPPDLPERVVVLERLLEKMDQRMVRVEDQLVAIRSDITQMRVELGERIERTRGQIGERIAQVNGDLGERVESISGQLVERIAQVNNHLGERIEFLSGSLQHVPRIWHMVILVFGSQLTLADCCSRHIGSDIEAERPEALSRSNPGAEFEFRGVIANRVVTLVTPVTPHKKMADSLGFPRSRSCNHPRFGGGYSGYTGGYTQIMDSSPSPVTSVTTTLRPVVTGRGMKKPRKSLAPQAL
jgi:hypothetical protein